MIKKGDWVQTPRFLLVKINEVFKSEREAREAGYTETTHYLLQHDNGYNVLGKVTGENKIVFAAARL